MYLVFVLIKYFLLDSLLTVLCADVISGCTKIALPLNIYFANFRDSRILSSIVPILSKLRHLFRIDMQQELPQTGVLKWNFRKLTSSDAGNLTIISSKKNVTQPFVGQKW